ncbi:hypothetical protein NHX12_025671 [Muraenolepis orangiensis]|uniref:DUF4503 domain-containing protein n=1 Tax=Muraenolepis orangiensis TaxID=630683 RepID=A0A9Q0EF51_9TELE|nr:hypothetical protein NHX12_025671 [Muraenolepis orangiensis]
MVVYSSNLKPLTELILQYSLIFTSCLACRGHDCPQIYLTTPTPPPPFEPDISKIVLEVAVGLKCPPNELRPQTLLFFHRFLCPASDVRALPCHVCRAAVRPGVLVLEVLEVWEECSMQVARCEQRGGSRSPAAAAAGAAATVVPAARLLVLFNRETAAQLMPTPKDVIHVYPPWQRLDLEDQHTTVILNTHFSHKVYSEAKPTGALMPWSLPPPAKCSPYSLTETFGPLLEVDAVIEGLGLRAGSTGPGVRVVVQRVYSSYLPDRPAATVERGEIQASSSVRLCALVQDGYGLFGVLQLQVLEHGADQELQRYTRRWQGKDCALRNIKVVQRVTRERHGRVFHVIDSVWPPGIPFQGGRGGAGSAPRSCYLLSGQEDSVEAPEGPALSPLYRPPKELTLRDVLHFCGDRGVRPMADPSLQEERAEGGPCRRTVAVCVGSSCVLSSSVAGVMRSPSSAVLSFRDVVRENGALLCTEQSVVRTQPGGGSDGEGESEPSVGPPLAAVAPPGPVPPVRLPRPVRLDPLGPDAAANSLYTLTGVIVGVDESTACSWPACSLCGSDRLEVKEAREPRVFHCAACDSEVRRPSMKLQLEVTLALSLSNATVKAKLQPNTILSILNTAALQVNEFPGYEVEHVLGKTVGPIPAFVRVVSRTPQTLRISVDEISL